MKEENKSKSIDYDFISGLIGGFYLAFGMYFLNSWFRSSQIFLSFEAEYFFVSVLIQMLTVGLLYFSMLGFLFLLGRLKKDGFREGANLKGNKLLGLFVGGGLGILVVLLFL